MTENHKGLVNFMVMDHVKLYVFFFFPQFETDSLGCSTSLSFFFKRIKLN